MLLLCYTHITVINCISAVIYSDTSSYNVAPLCISPNFAFQEVNFLNITNV